MSQEKVQIFKVTEMSSVTPVNKYVAKLPFVSDLKVKGSRTYYAKPTEDFLVIESRLAQSVNILTANGKPINPISNHRMNSGREFDVYKTSEFTKKIVLEVSENV